MEKNAKLLSLYNSLLKYASMGADENGAVEIGFCFDDDRTPVKIDEKRLMLPTEANLKNFHPQKHVVFHPLAEYINRGESDVVRLLRNQLNIRINYTIFSIAGALLRLASSPAEQKKLTPEQQELILSVETNDTAIIERWMKVIGSKYTSETSRFFSNIYLKKAGTYEGKKHARVGVVHFPVFEYLKATDKELKLKTGDVEVFRSLLEFILPSSNTEGMNEAYNSFSDNRDAPWLCCLYRTSVGITDRLNELLKIYADYIPNAKSLMFNVDWADSTDNMEDFDYYRAEMMTIPAQKGSEGSIESTAPVAAPVKAAEPASRPAQTSLSPNELPVPEVTRQLQPTAIPYPQHMPYAGNQQQQPLFDAYGRQVYPDGRPIPVAAPEKNSDGSIDFDAVLRRNPAVAAAGQVNTVLTQWQRPVDPRMAQYHDPRVAPNYGPSQYTGGVPVQNYPQQWGNNYNNNYPNGGYPNSPSGMIRNF